MTEGTTGEEDQRFVEEQQRFYVAVVYSIFITAFFAVILILLRGLHHDYRLALVVPFALLALSMAAVLQIGMLDPRVPLARPAIATLIVGLALNALIAQHVGSLRVSWWAILPLFLFAALVGLTTTSVEGFFEYVASVLIGFAIPSTAELVGLSANGVATWWIAGGTALSLWVLKKGPSIGADLGYLGPIAGYLANTGLHLDAKAAGLGRIWIAVVVVLVIRVLFGLLPLPQPRKVLYALALIYLAIGAAAYLTR